jgi:hypothetical protein
MNAVHTPLLETRWMHDVIAAGRLMRLQCTVILSKFMHPLCIIMVCTAAGN